MSEPANDRLKLPVLPLKEIVVFPGVDDAARGRSGALVKLIDDVVSGERMLALFTVENEEADRRAGTTSTSARSRSSTR